MTEQPLLSIIITSYTMERLNDIFDLLDSIKAQTYPNIETILIVERSTELFERLKQYAVEINIPRTKILFNDGERGLSAARNMGVSNASGEIIAFVDDDAFPVHDWAEEIVKTYQDISVIGLTGPSIPLWEEQGLDWVPEEFYWIIGGSGYNEWTENREIRNVSGTNMSFRKEAFDTAGLFLTQLGAKGGGASGKHELVGDETELSIRVTQKTSKRILYNPKVKVRHKVYKFRVKAGFIARRAYWEGYTKALFKHNYNTGKNGSEVLKVEHQLLRRILIKLIPEILFGFFTRPVISWRKFGLTVNAVFFVGLGYLQYTLESLTGHGQTISYEKKG